MNSINSNYLGAHKSTLEQVCQERGVAMHSLWQMLADLKVKCFIVKDKDSQIEIDMPDDILRGDYLARGKLAKEIKKYAPEIIKALKEEKPTPFISNTAVPTAPNLLSLTITGTGAAIESITAVIDRDGLKNLSKWIKPTENNPTGKNLKLKFGGKKDGTIITRLALSTIPIINSSDVNAASFISNLEKFGMTLNYSDERLQIDASRLMEMPTGPETLSKVIEDMKIYMAENKDEILKYLQYCQY